MGQEGEVVSISGSAHLQGRQWVDMSGWSEGSKDKGEVCVRCEGVGGVGWGSQKSHSSVPSATNDATYIPHMLTNTCTMLVLEMQAQCSTHTHTCPPTQVSTQL